MSLPRFLQYAFIAIVTVTVGFSLYQWNASRAANKINTSLNLNTNGLVGHWTFDGKDTVWTSSTAGTTADTSGNGNTGTLTNMNQTTSPIDGKIGQAFNIASGSGDYINLGSATSLDDIENQGGGGMTVMAWINPRSNGDSDNPTIVGKTNGGGGPNTSNGYWRLAMGGNRLTFGKSFSTTTLFTMASASTPLIYDNQWKQVVATWDGSASYANVHLYINGAEVGGYTSQSNGVGTKVSDASVNMNIGANSPTIDGAIDDVRIYNRVLSAGEIQSLYTSGTAKINTTQNSNLTNGLVGLWSFNGADVSGTTAYDRSGGGGHGTLTNGVAITEGQLSQALSFDGTNDYVSLPISATTAFNTASRSVSMWMKTTGASGTRYAFSGGNGSPSRYYIGTNGLALHSTVGDGASSMSSTALYANEWYHVVVTYESGIAKTYLNGALDSQASVTLTGTGGAQTVNIGSYMFGSGNFFSGSVDDVRIYNRALSAGEIESLYNFGSSDKINSSVSQKQGAGHLDSGLASYWKFDDGSGTSAIDSSVNGNTGILTGGTLPTWGTGYIGGGLDFNGTIGSYVLGPSSYTGFNNDYTVSLWVKSTDVTTNSKSLVNTYNGFGSTSMKFYFKKVGINQAVRFTSVGAELSYVYDITDGNWHHLVVTRTIDGMEKVYADGRRVGQNTATAGALTMGFGNTTLRIGGSDVDSMNGSLDEVRIYNRALSADEISQLYHLNAPTGVDTSLKGYWSFNGPDISGTTAYDRSGTSNNGTLENSPSITEGKLGQALSFNGANTRITMGSPASLDNLTNFTYSAWVNVLGSTGNGSNARILVKDIGGDNNSGAILEYDTGTFHNDVFRALVGFDTTDALATSQNMWSITGGGSNYNGGWHHVAMTYDGTSKSIALYLNGTEVSYQAHTTGVGTRSDDSAGAFYIGNSLYGTRAFNGKIDEPRIYDRVLSASEIASLYNSSR